jgi:threonine aldolase
MLPFTVDLRSDTVTQPTPAMRAAMAAAEVGDDVLGADPTTAKLEQLLAERLGKEAAIFMPSGTMTNQVAVRLHCLPGDELLCEQDCHIYQYEQGAFAQLSGVVAHTILGNRGVLTVDQLEACVRPDNEHMVRTRLVCLENTHNRGGGKVLPWEECEKISRWAREAGLSVHLDGARFFNAVISSGIDAQRWASLFDTVSVCFSKGLGAPVGSALAGPRDLIRLARRHRKVLGGGMRQCGIIAAGALHALHHHVERLADDHYLARQLADAIGQVPGLRLTYDETETNIVYFDVDPRLGTASEFAAELAEAGVLTMPEMKHRIRVITHLDVDARGVELAAEVIGKVARRRA